MPASVYLTASYGLLYVAETALYDKDVHNMFTSIVSDFYLDMRVFRKRAVSINTVQASVFFYVAKNSLTFRPILCNRVTRPWCGAVQRCRHVTDRERIVLEQPTLEHWARLAHGFDQSRGCEHAGLVQQ